MIGFVDAAMLRAFEERVNCGMGMMVLAMRTTKATQLGSSTVSLSLSILLSTEVTQLKTNASYKHPERRWPNSL
jgi:hypothetical protein